MKTCITLLLLTACYLLGIAANMAFNYMATDPECDFSGATPDDPAELMDLYRCQAFGLPYYEN